MKVCILGNGLTSLALAKMLINHGIKVDILSDKKISKYNKIQTLGISKSNLDFFNKNILNISKLTWDINQIEIYNEKLKNEKILDFKNKDSILFSLIKNSDLYNNLYSKLKNNNYISFKKNLSFQDLSKKKYDLVFNCDQNHLISKKFFYKKINKNYNSLAYITILKHKKISNNKSAIQIFTKKGPLAFLPISQNETSVVYSARGYENVDLENLIKKNNTKFEILKINKIFNFELKSSSLRTYYHSNIIAFGDLLHRLHPLAGQGFNMTIRDIKEIQKLILKRKSLGLELDTSICKDFEKNSRSKNFLFASGIDFIYEFFNFESKYKNKFLNNFVKLLGKNKLTNNFFTKVADRGIVF